MNRGTPALTVASSRTDCVPTITSRNPCSADTTQDAPEHASVNWEAWLQSTLAIVTPSCCNRSSLSGVVPWRTSALTLALRSTRALAMRPPRLPVAPATTMVPSFMIPILEKRQRRSKVGDNTTSALALRGAQAWFQIGLERGNSALEVDRIVVFALKPRDAVSRTSRSIRRFVERMAAGATNRARARADGNSPDEMSGRYGEVVRRTQARFPVPNLSETEFSPYMSELRTSGASSAQNLSASDLVIFRSLPPR